MPQSIPLIGGAVALVDDADVERIAGYRWRLNRGGYAMALESVGGTVRTTYMHRLIMDAPKGLEVDHLDGVKLNNTRANLRLCTRAENEANKPKMKGTKCRFRGVWQHWDGRWRAHIYINCKRHLLGYFQNEEDAARAYDAAATKAWGARAHLNLPTQEAS